MVIDAHVHFWDPAELSYPWLGSVPALQRAFGPNDYPPFAGDARCERVDAVLFVEANCAPDAGEREVAYVERLAAGEPRLAGIVAFVDLLDVPAREATLERLASRPLVVGVRHNVQGHPTGYALQSAFVDGVRAVGRHGLTFDLCITASQLPDAIELVRRVQGTRIVLDHCGKPAIRDGDVATWRSDLVQLAAHDHISCKLSGLLTEASEAQRHVAALQPYLERVVECFGVHRVMYGSDWPVCTLGGGATRWREIVAHFTAAWSPDEQDGFYAGNATRTYGLTFDD